MNVTKIGTINGFVAIERPSTKFDEAGVYSCQVEFTGADAKEMKATIDELMASSLANGKGVKRSAAPPYTIEGKSLIVKFKQKARITSKAGDTYEKKVKIFDASNKEVKEELNIGVGTSVKVAYKPYMWAVAALGCGCTLQLEMVQVIDLVKREGGGSGNPFESLEGFTAAKRDEDIFTDSKPVATVDLGDDDDF